jgi:hypothetical protein
MYNKITVKVISFFVAIAFLFTNCAWAGQIRPINTETLAAVSRAGEVGQDLARYPLAGKLFADMKILEELGINNLADVFEKLNDLRSKGVLTLPITDAAGKEVVYVFGDGVILRKTTKGEVVNDALVQLLASFGIQGTKDELDNNAFEWFEVKDSAVVTAINGFLGSSGQWTITPVGAVRTDNSHLLPQYLYQAFRDKLIELKMATETDVDEYISNIAYTDKDGNVSIQTGRPLEVMAAVLSNKLGKSITAQDVLKVLQMHEEIHRIIKTEGIDLNSALKMLKEYFNSDLAKLDTFLCSFARNYNYFPQIDLVNNVFVPLTDEQRLMVVEELLVHTIVERRNFKQPVRVLDKNGVRSDIDVGIEKMLVDNFAKPIVQSVKARLDLSDSDRGYLYGLYKRFLLPLVAKLRIGENFFPSAMMSVAERQDVLGAVEYGNLVGDAENMKAAENVVLTLNAMDGGIGSSVKRDAYLKSIKKARLDAAGNVILGSKSSDLYFEVNGKLISVMEAKLIKAILQSKKGELVYSEITYQLLGSKETQESLTMLLGQPCFLDPTRTYKEYIAQETTLEINDVLLQAPLARVDATRIPEFLKDQTAPGGHGQWGVMLLLKALGLKLPADGRSVISAFYNGDGINNGTDPVITGWMARNRVPIIMISTTKTGIDKKGGQIGAQYLGDKKTNPRKQMAELAQAKQAGQEQLFYRIGLEDGVADGAEEGKQYFNTNTALLNYTVLTPFLVDLVDVIGEDRFLEVISPDLIENIEKNSLKLEGALGSVLLNLDTFVQTTQDDAVIAVLAQHGFIDASGKRTFLRIVNTDKNPEQKIDERTKFFTPQKDSFDYWYQFESGRFRWDEKSWELVDNYPELPLMEIDKTDKQYGTEDYYKDVTTVLNSFKGTDVIHLTSLTLVGKVKMPNVVLKGEVVIEYRNPGELDINTFAEALIQQGLASRDEQGRLVLDNVRLVFEKKGTSVKAAPLSKKIDTEAPEITYATVTVDMQGNVVDMQTTTELKQYSDKELREKVASLLDYLKKTQGVGIFGPINKIVIVNNMGGIDSDIPAEQRGMAAFVQGDRLVIDIDVFANDIALTDVGTHEVFESLLTIVEQNEGIREVTATYSSVQELFKRPQAEIQSYIDFLRNPDNGLDSSAYADFLQYILENPSVVSDNDALISLSAGYIANMPRYDYLANAIAGVGGEDVTLALSRVKDIKDIYNQIIYARTKSVEVLKPLTKSIADEAKFAQAKTKIKMLTSVWRVNTDFIEKLLKNNKFVRLDVDELVKPENKYVLDWLKTLMASKTQTPFVFYSRSGASDVDKFLKDNNLNSAVLPESIQAQNIIDLVDPVNVNNQLPQNSLYMPLPYSVSSIYLASQVVVSEGKISQISDKLVASTIKSLYTTLLGKDITDEELNELFRTPWTILPPITQITGTLNALRNAIAQIEVAA